MENLNRLPLNRPEFFLYLGVIHFSICISICTPRVLRFNFCFHPWSLKCFYLIGSKIEVKSNNSALLLLYKDLKEWIDYKLLRLKGWLQVNQMLWRVFLLANINSKIKTLILILDFILFDLKNHFFSFLTIFWFLNLYK